MSVGAEAGAARAPLADTPKVPAYTRNGPGRGRRAGEEERRFPAKSVSGAAPTGTELPSAWPDERRDLITLIPATLIK